MAEWLLFLERADERIQSIYSPELLVNLGYQSSILFCVAFVFSPSFLFSFFLRTDLRPVVSVLWSTISFVFSLDTHMSLANRHQALVYKFGTLRHYMPLVEEAERARLRHVQSVEAGAGPKLAPAVVNNHNNSSSSSSAGPTSSSPTSAAAAATTTTLSPLMTRSSTSAFAISPPAPPPTPGASTATPVASPASALQAPQATAVMSAAQAAQAAAAASAAATASAQAQAAARTQAAVAAATAATAPAAASTITTTTAVTAPPLAPETMEVDVEGTGAGEEHVVNVEDDVDVGGGTHAGAPRVAAAAAAAVPVAVPVVTKGDSMDVDGGAARTAVVGRTVVPAPGAGASATGAVGAAGAVVPSHARAVVGRGTIATAPGAPATAAPAARSQVQSGAEVANSAAATLKIARAVPPPREDGAPRKFALGGPPEIGDSIQEVKVSC